MLRSISPASDAVVSEQSSKIMELREELSALTTQVTEIAAKRLAAAKKATEQGADFAGEKVAAYPISSMALAFGAGAVIGLALLPRRTRSKSWGSASISDVQDDLSAYAEQLKRSLRNSASRNGLTSRFESMADSVSQIDPKASVAPVLNRLMSWVENAKDRAGTVAADVAKRVS